MHNRCRYSAWRRPDFLRWKGSVLPNIFPSILLISLFSALIAFAYSRGWNIALPITIVPSMSIVVGMLLVFRTNGAYDRFYEGRRAFQQITATIRTLLRTMWYAVPEKGEDDRAEKVKAMRLTIAFIVAVQHHLRGELGADYEDMVGLLPDDWPPRNSHPDAKAPSRPYPTPANSNGITTSDEIAPLLYNGFQSYQSSGPNMPPKYLGQPTMSLPLEILLRIAYWIAKQRRNSKIDSTLSNSLSASLSTLTDTLTILERILRTPIPSAYNIHLKQTVTMYCVALPFTLVHELKWAVIPVVTLIAFTLIGIDGIASEIESPFGYDPNDLKIEEFVNELKGELEFLLTHCPPTPFVEEGCEVMAN
ncbi:uncharacterized protein VTP21DRAFT_3431 [Calcarisporiella thermophila]|uniref:uncharacterized protein n=1 Tax=Calcarisporiella thermophila TaxID=911321 RepID=UPI0037425A4A